MQQNARFFPSFAELVQNIGLTIKYATPCKLATAPPPLLTAPPPIAPPPPADALLEPIPLTALLLWPLLRLPLATTDAWLFWLFEFVEVGGCCWDEVGGGLLEELEF